MAHGCGSTHQIQPAMGADVYAFAPPWPCTKLEKSCEGTSVGTMSCGACILEKQHVGRMMVHHALWSHLHPLSVAPLMQEAPCLPNDNWELPAVARPLAVALVLQVAKSDRTLLPESVTQESALGD